MLCEQPRDVNYWRVYHIISNRKIQDTLDTFWVGLLIDLSLRLSNCKKSNYWKVNDTTFIKAKLKSKDQTNIDKYRKYYRINISRLIFLRITKFTMIRQLVHVKKVSKCKKSICLNWTYSLLGQNYRVVTLSTFYLTISKISIPSWKSIRQL